MQAIVVLLLFVGTIMVMHGIYEEQVAAARRQVRVETRYVPRTYYEEQLGNTADVMGKFKGMFDASAPWIADRAL
jgi:hypothetical protein